MRSYGRFFLVSLTRQLTFAVLFATISAVSLRGIPEGKNIEQMRIEIGQTDIIDFSAPIVRISIADPEVADASVTSPTQLIVNGKELGATTMIVWDELERYEMFKLIVHSENTTRQVMLKVRFAEVDRKAFRELGVNFWVKNLEIGSETADIGSFGGQVNAPSDPFTIDDNVDLFLAVPTQNISSIIRAFEEKSLLNMLARPNLSALSGTEASFLAGGEIPVPIVSGVSNQVTIEYKEFGIRLKFIPTVLDSELVNVHVETEVSSLDFDNGIILSGFRIPALISRKAETSIELKDGEHFAIGGLVSNDLAQAATKIPFLGHIPILGKLFSSSRFLNNESELLIMISPHIVQPMKGNLVPE